MGGRFSPPCPNWLMTYRKSIFSWEHERTAQLEGTGLVFNSHLPVVPFQSQHSLEGQVSCEARAIEASPAIKSFMIFWVFFSVKRTWRTWQFGAVRCFYRYFRALGVLCTWHDVAITERLPQSQRVYFHAKLNIFLRWSEYSRAERRRLQLHPNSIKQPTIIISLQIENFTLYNEDSNKIIILKQSRHERSRHRLGMGWTNVHAADR